MKQSSLPLTHRIVPPAILAALTALVYWPSLHYEFQFDDLANITRYYSIRHSTFAQLFFSGTRWISYWLNTVHYHIGMFDPFSYRLFNVSLHIANGLLIYYILLWGLSQLRSPSFFKDNALALACTTSLLFLLHPVQTQTVSYVIQGQLEGLAAFFILSMCFGLLQYAQTNSQIAKRTLFFLLCILAFLSTGSKEIAIIGPALVLITDWFFVAQGSWKNILQRIWLHATITLVVVSCYLWFLKPAFFLEIFGLQKIAHNNFGNVITAHSNASITFWLFFISQFKVILHYLWIFIWPVGLSVEYDWVLAKHFFSPDCILPFILLMAIASSTAYLLKKNSASLIAFGLVWFFVSIAPRSSIIPSPELLVDYKTYIASVGWLFLIASVLVYCASKITQINFASNILPSFASSALIVPLLAGTYFRNTVWRSGLEFWSNILENAPRKARVQNNYGFELAKDKGRMIESIPYFKKALELDPRYPDAYNNLAVVYGALGKIDEAIDSLKKSLAINPNHPESHNNLASLYLQKKEYSAAKQQLEQALRLRPHYGKAHFNLGCVYSKTGNPEQAWECFKNGCIQGDFDQEIGFATYAFASFQLEKWDHAIIGFKKTLERNPSNIKALFQLANSYYFIGNFALAKESYQKLLALTPHDDRVWYNLGETFRELHDYRAARDAYLKVINPAAISDWHLQIAFCFHKLNDTEAAHDHLRELLAGNPNPNLAQKARSLLASL